MNGGGAQAFPNECASFVHGGCSGINDIQACGLNDIFAFGKNDIALRATIFTLRVNRGADLEEVVTIMPTILAFLMRLPANTAYPAKNKTERKYQHRAGSRTHKATSKYRQCTIKALQ